MSNNDDDSSWADEIRDSPLAYAIFPLVILIIAVFIIVVLYVRRRRRRATMIRNGEWPPVRRTTGDPSNPNRRNRNTGNRWAPWSGTRTEEGLNELGEAPPPYDPKRENSDEHSGLELRDLEANRPPEYPAEPGPAVTRNPPPNIQYG